VQPPTDQRTARPGFRPGPRWLLAGLVVLAAVGFYALGLHRYLCWDYLRNNRDFLLGQVREHLVLALLLFFLGYVAVTALSLPAATVMSLAAGALFGLWTGVGVVSLAATLGATLAFLLSRYLLRDWVTRHFGARLEPLNRGVDRDGAAYLFTLRLVPVFPFFLVNLGMGLTRLPVRTFFWVSLLGMLPATVVYVNAGTRLATLNSPRDVLSPSVLVSLALLGLVPLGLRQLVRHTPRLWRRQAGGAPDLRRGENRERSAARPKRSDH
jgi:uncharacterized membrane protein YdjX (TVP38/TMEM64 family)